MPSWRHLGSVLEVSWGGLGARRPSLGRLEDILEVSEAILGRLDASNGGKMKHSMLHVVFEFILNEHCFP